MYDSLDVFAVGRRGDDPEGGDGLMAGCLVGWISSRCGVILSMTL